MADEPITVPLDEVLDLLAAVSEALTVPYLAHKKIECSSDYERFRKARYELFADRASTVRSLLGSVADMVHSGSAASLAASADRLRGRIADIPVTYPAEGPSEAGETRG